MLAQWKVVHNQQVAPKIMRMTLLAVNSFPAYLPGQFLHIRVTQGVDHLLRRPISICSVDAATKQLSIVYRVSGKGTELLALKQPGDQLDILGPLGKGFPLHTGDTRALLIGGGIGVPPLLELAKQLTNNGTRVTIITGFQSAEQVILQQELAQYGEVLTATDDGSLGNKGFVTSYLTDERVSAADRYYACGPSPMLRAVQRILHGKLPGYLSLEERMGCGIGLCAGCVHKAVLPDGTVGYRKVCKEGPVFRQEEVIFA